MRSKNVNKFIHLFLLALFLSYYGSITFFSHYHVVNGVTIVHSHFFHGDTGSDGGANHTHSAKELTLIAHLSNFITLVSLALVVSVPHLIHKIHYYIHKQEEEPDKQTFTLSPLRAPPFTV